MVFDSSDVTGKSFAVAIRDVMGSAAHFINHLLQLFNIKHEDECDLLMRVLHKLYLKILGFRKIIRESICAVFYNYVYETQQHSGISYLLEFWRSFADGFNVPLRSVHIAMYKRLILPLYKVHVGILQYEAVLQSITEVYCTKDKSLFKPTIQTILSFWPKDAIRFSGAQEVFGEHIT